MKVMLVQPNSRFHIEKTSHPHTGLAYLGAYALQRGHETIAIDARYESISNTEVIDRITRVKPNILGITMRTPDYKAGEEISITVKKKLPDINILVGGAHVTGIQERALKECPSFDVAVIGEGELTFCELLDTYENGYPGLSNIKGIAYRIKGNPVVNPPREYITDLDSLLFPAWELFSKGSDSSLFTSRGCPYSCMFCQRVLGQKVRRMSPRRAIQEMKWNISKFGATFFQIEDEVFGIDRQWINELLDLMMQEGINKKVRWMANSRVNIANLDIYRRMKEAGCIGLGFGIESGNQKILDFVQKGIRLEDACNAIMLAKKAGLQTHAFFILGHPWETRKTVRDTINFACKLNPYGVSFGMMVPYPGTKIYDMAKKGEGGYRGFHERWDGYTKYFGESLELEGLSRSRLARYQKQAYVEFYIRNLRIIELVSLIRRYFRRK